MRKKIASYIVMIIISLLISYCSKSQSGNNSGIITFVSGEVKINDSVVLTGAKVNINDSISTGPKSLAIVQFNDKALVTLQSNTLVKISSAVLSGPGEYELFHQQGILYNKIKKGTKFRIKTPTLVASVRGTSFFIKCNTSTNKTSCSVLNGTVAIANLKTEGGEKLKTEEEILSGEEVLVNAGYQTVQFNNKIEEPTAIDELQKNELIKYENLILMDNPENAKDSDDIKDTPFMSEEVKQNLLNDLSMELNSGDNIVMINEPIIDKPVDPKIIYKEKLNEIKIQNNGKLDKITLRDGQVILGMITERGRIYKIVTPDGTIEIYPKDIESQIITH